MADQIIQNGEEMVGAGHATKADTLNRALLVEHNADGTHTATNAYAMLSGNQTVATDTDAKIAFAAERWDHDSGYDAANYKYTSPIAQTVFVAVCVYAQSLASGNYLIVKLYKNGAAHRVGSVHASSAAGIGAQLVVPVALAADDYLEVYCRHNKGSDATILSAYSYFSVFRLLV